MGLQPSDARQAVLQDDGGGVMTWDNGVTRRGFLGLSFLMGVFAGLSPLNIRRLPQLELTKEPLKSLLLRRSCPVKDIAYKDTLEDGSMIVSSIDSPMYRLKLNRTSAMILNWCDGVHTPYDMARMLEDTFGIERQRAEKDMFYTLKTLYNSRLIKV